jgi:formate dehydrogenase subunit delta
MTTIPPEIRLGNDIARQFAHLPEREAVERIATHIEKFWDPRMRRRLAALADPADPDIDPLVLQAVSRLVVDHIGQVELGLSSGG